MADVPLSDRPLLADDENTVISAPETRQADATSGVVLADSVLARLFPPGGVSNGEESGIRLAHFEIRERLGAGGMGAVFRATDLELARDVALKIMHPSSSGDNSLVARFRNEARACAHLNHDNIARVYYAGSQDGIYFIAYELADGRTIKDLIFERGQLSPGETVNYAIQVTLALNHIAAAGIVHRDIKPSNIMLTEAGRVKVVDLGLARRDVTDSIGDITVAGTTLGTFDYIAPEQAREPRNADIRSDIYSLGCTMYHMLTGQPPYPEGTALQKLLDHQGKSAPDPRSINASISAELAAVIRKMMSSDPNQRYQAPALLLSDLLHVAQLLGLQSIPAEGIVWRKPLRSTERAPHGALWVFLSVLTICIAALVVHRFPVSVEPADGITSGDDLIGVQTVPESFSPSSEKVPSASSVTDPLVAAKDTSSGKQKPGNEPYVASAGTGDNVVAESGQKGPVAETRFTRPSESFSGAPSAWPVPGFSPELLIAEVAIGDIRTAVEDVTVSGPEAAPRSSGGSAVSSPDAVARELEGPFILQRAEGGLKPRSFSTLQGAVADARSGDVILLRYNGYPADLPVQPSVRISGMNLIIRSAEGYRPTLEFSGERGSSNSRADFFTLRNRGLLTVRDVDLRLKVADDLAVDRWTLFRLDGPNRIQLENVTIDCQGTDGPVASVFELSDENASGGNEESVETAISLDRVVCRGAADGFAVNSQPRGRIRIQQSLFAVSGSVLRNSGSSSMLQSRGELELWLEHSSFAFGKSLFLMRDSDELTGRGPQRTLPEIAVNSDACVFASSSERGRLVVSEGNSYIEDIESTLSWNGFTNLYFQISTMWHIETAALDYTSRDMDSIAWREYWLERSDSEENNPVELTASDWIASKWLSEKPFPGQTFQPVMFQLRADSFRQTAGGKPLARDGQISGAAVTELRPFPVIFGVLPQSSEKGSSAESSADGRQKSTDSLSSASPGAATP